MPKAINRDPQYLEKQYRNAGNLNARILLHQCFSANPYVWQRWVFDHFGFPNKARLLEVGCGPGNLWLENLDRLPAGWQITLADFSLGMLDQARMNLKDLHEINYQLVNADKPPLPFETGAFDAVIANHMVYHLSNKGGFFSEVRRILKRGSTFFAATNGFNHMHEIDDLLVGFNPGLNRQRYIDSFTLENGAEQLGGWFDEVNCEHYEDSLDVTNANLLADYILSGSVSLDEDEEVSFRNYLVNRLQSAGGSFYITKAAGLFMAK